MAAITQPRPQGSSTTRLSARKLLKRTVIYIMALVFSAMFVFPFFWTVSTSLKEPVELIAYSPTLLPIVPRWENYGKIWSVGLGISFGQFFFNSTFVTGVALIGQIITAFLVGYGFARFRFPGRNAIFALCLSTMILPPHVTIIPLFVLFRNLHWIDTFLPLIVPSFFGGGAFTIFLIRQFIMSMPIELDEAALIDGAGRVSILWHIILPNSGPVLATAAIFGFIGHWNQFLEPLIFLNGVRKYTIPLGLWFLRQQEGVAGLPNDNLLMAASVLATAPIIVIFFVSQKYFVRGIAMTGLKG
ncbi:MAG: carbohydrate ABC transporter permease [Caldilineaceae bacterium]|nr:carbohydrate ABC transporter permease [Caldilineaceae bacterium]HRJ41034.1 carbohydrate ABC transporter permease [Caldilineaceae bacterium]